MAIINNHDTTLLSSQNETMANVSVAGIDEFCTKSTNDAPPGTSSELDRLAELTIDEPPIHEIPHDSVPSEKRVHFSIDDDGDKDSQDKIGTPSLWTTLTRDIVEELWYQPDEIASMKAEAKYYILNRKGATPDQLCGLDRFTSQRALWKRSSIQYVLTIQKKNKGEEFIRRASLRCSDWFREKACEQGFKDYCAVHDPLSSLLDSDNVENYNECFFSNTECVVRDGDNNNANAEKNSTTTTTNEEYSLKRSFLELDEDKEENEQGAYKRQRSI